MKIAHKKISKKAFTLVEMLIVIIIIGVLAAALIPRLSSARGRANDTARRAHLRDIGTAIMAYYFDNGTFPACAGACSIDAISGALLAGGLSSIPTDPVRDNAGAGMSNTPLSSGQYQYMLITKNGNPNGGFVVMAKTETPGGANRIINTSATDLTGGLITSTDDFVTINSKMCGSEGKLPVTVGSGTNFAGCSIKSTELSRLRYIINY